MKFSLVICTYKRAAALEELLESVSIQSLYPDEILIVDSSPDDDTANLISSSNYTNLKYFKVGKEDKGLTRQRNFGILKTTSQTDIICFLDDDIVLTENYFEKLISTYDIHPNAYGVGGYIINEIKWYRKDGPPCKDEYELDNWIRKYGKRNLLRKKLGLLSNESPGIMPNFSNGLSISFLPPTGRIYSVEFFMGGVSSYKKFIFKEIKFSEYFDGYGLYEDMDFCLRLSKRGQLFVNTGARVFHKHDRSGRPNKFLYGKMVLRNGWYVWRTKFPKPNLKARLKWYFINIVLILVRLGNSFNSTEKTGALTESLGRMIGLLSLIFNKPNVKKYENLG